MVVESSRGKVEIQAEFKAPQSVVFEVQVLHLHFILLLVMLLAQHNAHSSQVSQTVIFTILTSYFYLNIGHIYICRQACRLQQPACNMGAPPTLVC